MKTVTLQKLLPALLFSGALLAATSCTSNACRNTNPVFDSYSPSTKQYKEELAKQLESIDKSKLTYRLESYQENSDGRYLVVKLQGDGLCARIPLAVTASQNGIERILANKGAGYRDAELKNLRFDIQQNGTNTQFIFAGVDGVID